MSTGATPRPDESVEIEYQPGHAYRAIRRFDPDLFELIDAGKWDDARALLRRVCRCNHLRAHHMGTDGSLASFGGSACNLCWMCGTFTAKDSDAEQER